MTKRQVKPNQKPTPADGPKMRPLFSMRSALESPKLFGKILAGDSWSVWRVVLIAAMGEELTPAERVIFKQVSGRDHEPGVRIEELVGAIGRRSGKSRASSVLAAYIAARCEHTGLAPGERGRLLCLAQNRETAAVVLQYIEGIFDAVPRLTPLIINRTAESLSLSNNIDIEVRSASFRGLRGVTSVGVIADEASFWYDESSGSANSDTEILNSVRPSLATTGGPLIIISSPHGKSGEVYNTYKRHFGEQGDPRILVVNGETRTFNPSLPQSVVDRALERDPEKNKAEYLGLFRDDVANFISREVLDACVAPGRHELPPLHQVNYRGFVDSAGGSGGDSFTMAISHREADGTVVLDLIRERRPPFSPSEVIKEYCAECKRYGVGVVYGDRYGSEILAEQFRAQGIGYRPSEKSKSDLYLELLPLLNSRQVELLDNKRLFSQMANLERTVARGGKSTVDHPRNGRDDVANAAAGSLVRSAKRSDREIGIVGVSLNESSSPFPKLRKYRDPSGNVQETFCSDSEIIRVLRGTPIKDEDEAA
jgi:hypothetical protein